MPLTLKPLTLISACTHTSKRAQYIHTYIHTCMHTYIYACVVTLVAAAVKDDAVKDVRLDSVLARSPEPCCPRVSGLHCLRWGYMYVYTHVCTYACLFAGMYVYTHVCTYVCMYVLSLYIYIYICVHICIHAETKQFKHLIGLLIPLFISAPKLDFG
jgi:hypothetical protein